MKTALHEAVRERVIGRIMSGKFKSGSRLVESRLAEELKVSRTPLREALFQLEHEGFVNSDKDRGFTVAPLSIEEVDEIYPILWTLEALALRTSGGAVNSCLPELRALNRKMGAAKRSAAIAKEIDTKWHRTLISTCPNSRLMKAVESYRLLIQRYESLYMADSQRISLSTKQHDEVMDALEQSDLERAAQGLETNWKSGMELLRHVIKKSLA